MQVGFLDGSAGNESACSTGDRGDAGSIPRSGRFPGEGRWQPTPVFLTGFPAGSDGKECACTWIQSLGRKSPLEKGMATYSNIQDWSIPWMEEPGRPQSMGSQGVWHDWMTNTPPCTRHCSKSLHIWFKSLRNPMRKAPFFPFYISENESTVDLICHAPTMVHGGEKEVR